MTKQTEERNWLAALARTASHKSFPVATLVEIIAFAFLLASKINIKSSGSC